MALINWPNLAIGTSIGATYSVNGRSWIWTGYAWDGLTPNPSGSGNLDDYTYAIGEYVDSEGGIICHRWKSDTPFSLPLENGLKENYIVLDLDDLTENAEWGLDTILPPKFDSTWDGLANTQLMITEGASAGTAAQLCDASTNQGKSDWYLPAVDELRAVFNNRGLINVNVDTTLGFTPMAFVEYWSSTESPNNDGSGTSYFIGFSGGISQWDTRNTLCRVRAVRRFSIDSGSGPLPITPTYQFMNQPSTIGEDAQESFTINTTNVPDGTTLYWTITGDSGDFSTTSGSFVVNSGSGSFDITTVTGSLNGTFTISISTGSTTGPVVLTSPTVTIVENAWILGIETTAPGQQYSINLVGSGINLTVDWGDGTDETFTTSGIKSHTYSAIIETSVKIKGSITGRIQQNFFTLDPERVISTSVIRGITGITGFLSCLRNCTNLTTIPEGLFDNYPNITGSGFGFSFALALSGITSIPQNLFAKHTQVTSFTGTFSACPITEIPPGLFDTNINCTDLIQTFNGTSISSIPSGLFDNLTQVSSISAMLGNTDLTLSGIPIGIFDNLTQVTSIEGLFGGCNLLTTVPSNIFDSMTQLTNAADLFNNCTGLISIPSGLFDNNTLIDRLDGAFEGCTSLVTIPQGIFTSLIGDIILGGGTNFNRCFYGCTSLSSIPDNLFVKPNGSPLLSGFYTETFRNCTNLTLKSNMFGNLDFDGGCDFTSTFMLDSAFTGVQGTAPELWNGNYIPGVADRTLCFQGHSTSSLTNFNDIPIDWL